MARTFSITPTTETVKLSDPAAASETTFTVSNASLSPRRCGVAVVPSDPAKPDWFTVKGEPERLLKPGETTQFTVEIKIPPGTAEGTFQFRLDALDRDNPSEDNTKGPLVGVELSTPTPKIEPKPFPWWIIAVAAVVLIGAGVAVWLLLPKGVTVPKVVEMTLEDARTALTDRKLKVEEKMLIGNKPENTVVDQDPAEGVKVKKGDTVTIVYEPPMIEVPRVIGMDRDAAIDILESKKLVVRSVTEQRVDISKAGRVTGQSIPDKEKRHQGDEIDLTIEAGMVRPPDVRTKTAKEANDILTALGLVVDMKTVDQDRSKSGTIVDQKPEPLQIAQRGDTVHLTAQVGAIEVPPVTQKPVQVAKGLIEAAQLKAVIMPERVFPPPARVGDVGVSDPPAGTPLVKGESVKLYPVGQPATVPNVEWTPARPLTQTQAEQQIRANGLVPKVKLRHIKDAIHTALGGVAEQFPKAGGSPVLKGSTVKIWVVVSNETKIPIDADDIIRIDKTRFSDLKLFK